MTAFYILKTPIQLCLYPTQGKPCANEVVGAYIKLDNPYAVHPHCAAHPDAPRNWSQGYLRRDPPEVQHTQELLIADRYLNRVIVGGITPFQ